jgi:3-oxoadipate enol-lactonase
VELPPGRHVDLPGRGRTFVRELPGPEGAPTLLLLHGWTASSDLNWFGCYESLGERYRVVAMDHRGHGRGIRSRRPFRLSDCADDAAALIRHLHLGRVIVVGYSMGGLVAQLVWKRHRPLVAGLVLCATSRAFIASARERNRFNALGAFGIASRLIPRRLSAERIARAVGKRSSAGPLEGWAAEELRRNDWTAVFEAGRALGYFDSRPWAKDIDVPTAVVVPTHDSMIPAARQIALARAIRGATVHPIRAEHTVAGTQPERFVPVLLDAISSVTSRAAATTAAP